MSLRGDYTKNGFGLVIAEDDKDAACFLESTKKALGPDAGEPWSYTLPGRMESEGGVGNPAYFDESADTMFIPVDGKPGEYIENHNLFVFPADRQPDPFAVQYTRESVVEEFRENLAGICLTGLITCHISDFLPAPCIVKKTGGKCQEYERKSLLSILQRL